MVKVKISFTLTLEDLQNLWSRVQPNFMKKVFDLAIKWDAKIAHIKSTGDDERPFYIVFLDAPGEPVALFHLVPTLNKTGFDFLQQWHTSRKGKKS